MQNKLVCTLSFVAGVTAGSLITYQYLKEHYEQIAQEEIDSIKTAFAKKEKDLSGEIDIVEKRVKAEIAKEKPDIMEYTQKLQREGYVDYSGMSEKKEEVKEPMKEEPYIIAPEEFGEIEDYDKLGLTYYHGDQVLVDSDDEIIEDVENVVVEDFADHFGEYEDDSVFVRNPDRKADFEILLDYRSYADVVKNKPHLMEE